MNWIPLTEELQVAEIKQKSNTQPQVIFKHSTRCSISSVAKNRLEKNTPPSNAVFYFLDLIKFRNISDMVASVFSVHHESPQLLIIKNGECVYEETHSGINMHDIHAQTAA